MKVQCFEGFGIERQPAPLILGARAEAGVAAMREMAAAMSDAAEKMGAELAEAKVGAAVQALTLA